MLSSSVSLPYVVLLLLMSSCCLLFGSILLLKHTVRGRYAGFYLLAAAIFPAAMLITSAEGALMSQLYFEAGLFLGCVAWLLVLATGYMLMMTSAVTFRYLYRYTSLPATLRTRFASRFERKKQIH
ncbi:hypothetical protein [Exiguobacterium oxidotolerans]|uniref:hypothetical protein n=1 Tax=Exiguobacterium oxidotolerans TaxID=223958 RepID=UPI0004941029|nr:hypothetical protein [Exiguobacterium oxidotolerans]